MKQTHRYKEQTDGGLGEKDEALRSTDWWFQNTHRDIKYSMRNIVTNIVIAVYDARQLLEIPEDHFVEYMIF